MIKDGQPLFTNYELLCSLMIDIAEVRDREIKRECEVRREQEQKR